MQNIIKPNKISKNPIQTEFKTIKSNEIHYIALIGHETTDQKPIKGLMSVSLGLLPPFLLVARTYKVPIHSKGKNLRSTHSLGVHKLIRSAHSLEMCTITIHEEYLYFIRSTSGKLSF